MIDDQIFVTPPRACSIWADRRMHIRRETALDLLEVFEDPRARPIKVRAVLEDHKYVGVAEHRLRAHGFDAWRRKKSSHDRIRDLVLDDVRRRAIPGRVNDHLYVRDVRQCVEWNAPHRPDTGEYKNQRSCEHQKPVACTPVNPPADHCMPPSAVTLNCFCAIVCPFFVARTVTCQLPPICT